MTAPSRGPAGRPAAAGVTASAFRETLGAVAAPVTIVTAWLAGRPHGTTVSAFSSLSLTPPLVLICLDHRSDLLDAITADRRFGVNVLARDQATLAARFARPDCDRFDGTEWHDDGGLPRLTGTSAFLACELEAVVRRGDHHVLTALVNRAERSSRPGLVYCERSYAALLPLKN